MEYWRQDQIIKFNPDPGLAVFSIPFGIGPHPFRQGDEVMFFLDEGKLLEHEKFEDFKFAQVQGRKLTVRFDLKEQFYQIPLEYLLIGMGLTENTQHKPYVNQFRIGVLLVK